MRFLRLAFIALVVLASDATALSATSKLQRLSARINAESQRQHALAETQIYAENQDKGGNGLLTSGWVKIDDAVESNQMKKKMGTLVETETQNTEQEPDENSSEVLLETERLMSQLSSLETALQQAQHQHQQQRPPTGGLIEMEQQRPPTGGLIEMEQVPQEDDEDVMIERLSTQLSNLESALAQHQPQRPPTGGLIEMEQVPQEDEDVMIERLSTQLSNLESALAQQQQRGPVLMEQEPNDDDIDVDDIIGHLEDQLGSLERGLNQHQGPPGHAGGSTIDHQINHQFDDPSSNLPEFELMELSQQQQHDEEMMQRMESRVSALTHRLTQSTSTSDDDDDNTELLEYISDPKCPGFPPQYHYITKIGTTVINKCYDCSTYNWNWIWDGRTSCKHSGRFGW